jgi:zinc D-Ala-D-Ala dipeptidase
MADGFVDISSLSPGIAIEVRYRTDNNFVGEPITGYDSPKIIMSTEAAFAITKIQEDLASSGLGLKIFDAYRPQQAVDHFVRWASDLDDEAMKQQYYPQVEKANLFRDGYISARSGHSRGSTVDLTLIELTSGEELDMGSAWDFFDPISWPTSNLVSAEQKGNRNLLRDAMTKHGFRPLPEEWWHFTLDNEPYPDTYFDFPIE